MACGSIACAGGSVQEGNPSLPGDTSLPSSPEVLAQIAAHGTKDAKYQVEDFFTMPSISGYRISPDGKYLSWRKRNDEGKRDVWIRRIADGQERMLLKEGEDVIRGYDWINDDHLVFFQDKGGDENYHIYIIGLDDTQARDLTPFAGVRAGINNILKDDKEHIIIEMNKDNPQLFEPYKLNVRTGALEKLYENPADKEPIGDFTFDKDGNLRLISRIINGQDEDLYYKVDGEFKKIKHIPFGETFAVLGFDEHSDNPDDAYVLSNEEGDKAVIYRYDLKKNAIIAPVFSHDTYDVGGIRLSRKRGYELDAVSYNGEKPHIIPKSATFKAWMDKLHQHLGSDNDIHIADKDDDEGNLIVFLSSDREPGTYYLYNTETDTLQELTRFLPQLKRDDMATMTPITFTSRDGMTLHGYFSFPAHIPKNQPVPVVVIVHGGPQGIRDSWGFDPEVQLLTSQGYGVLQVNFRISGGYGKKFFNAGLGQVGRKTMDDVEDGVAYIIDKGWADPKRIAIYGGSHGGYAVLRGLEKTPDLYACGVDYVGVANLYTFMQTIPSYWEPVRKMLTTIWYDPENPEQQKIMNEVSPLQNADKITKPLFVVQGANDPRVNINEADQIVSTLRKRGVDVPYMVKYDEGHGFAKEPNRLDMQRTMIGFLNQCLKNPGKIDTAKQP